MLKDVDEWFRKRMEQHARRFGQADCRLCNGIGILYDPLGAGKAQGAYVLCSCLEKQARSSEPPYEYYDAERNVILPCPTQEARYAIERIHWLQANSGIPERLRQRFITSVEYRDPENPKETNQSLMVALDHAVATIDMFGEGKIQGLYLYGNMGTGKTLISCAVLNEIIRLYQVQARYAKISRDILGRLRSTFNPNSESYGEGFKVERELSTVTALVIDDFGVQRESEWVSSVLYDLIDARYEDNLLTIVTSNEPLESIRELWSGRVYSRLKEMCLEIHIEAPDYRLRMARRY